MNNQDKLPPSAYVPPLRRRGNGRGKSAGMYRGGLNRGHTVDPTRAPRPPSSSSSWRGRGDENSKTTNSNYSAGDLNTNANNNERLVKGFGRGSRGTGSRWNEHPSGSGQNTSENVRNVET